MPNGRFAPQNIPSRTEKRTRFSASRPPHPPFGHLLPLGRGRRGRSREIRGLMPRLLHRVCADFPQSPNALSPSPPKGGEGARRADEGVDPASTPQARGPAAAHADEPRDFHTAAKSKPPYLAFGHRLPLGGLRAGCGGDQHLRTRARVHQKKARKSPTPHPSLAPEPQPLSCKEQP